jgi:KUP system potassium uptake protein
MLIDLSFFSANMVKIADGGWFPLVFGLAIFVMLITWKRGRQLLHDRQAKDALPLKSFVAGLGKDEVARVPGTAVFMTASPGEVPRAMLHSLKHYKLLHQRVVILTVNVLDVPRVTDAQRVSVEMLPNHFWQVKVFYGFMDQPNLPEALEWCSEQGLEVEMMDTTFFLGRETLFPSHAAEMPFWQEKLFIAMFRNAGSAANFFQLPPNRVVELGAQVVL